MVGVCERLVGVCERLVCRRGLGAGAGIGVIGDETRDDGEICEGEMTGGQGGMAEAGMIREGCQAGRRMWVRERETHRKAR